MHPGLKRIEGLKTRILALHIRDLIVAMGPLRSNAERAERNS
jgi:hypothetical protein